MIDTETLAIAAHLHVLLRRISGRVTDTEWMAGNADYARAMVALARGIAASDKRPELADCAGKLEAAMGLLPAPPPTPPVVQTALPALPAVSPGLAPPQPGGRRYVGGLR